MWGIDPTRRRVTVAEALRTTAEGAPLSRPVEDALVTPDSPVVVVGRSPRAVAATTQTAVRRMLCDLTLVRVPDPHEVELAAVLSHARSVRPAVVLALDAPPSFLEQLDERVGILRDDDLRLVVGTRPTFLDAVLPRATREDLQERAVVLPDGDEESVVSEGLHTTTAALVEMVAAADRLGVRPALSWDGLVTAPGLGLPRRDDDGLGVLLDLLGAGAPERGLRRAERDARRRGLLQRVRRHGRSSLAATPALVEREGAVTGAVATWLVTVLTPAQRGWAGRVALARGETDVAATLLSNLDADLVGPRGAEILGRRAEKIERLVAEFSRDHQRSHAGLRIPDPRGDVAYEPTGAEAFRWYRVGIDGDDADVSRRCSRAAGLLSASLGHRAAARTYLADLDDEQDPEVQDALGRAAMGLGQLEEARRRLALVADGDGELAARAVETLARITPDDGDEEWLVRAARSTSRRRAFVWWLLLVDRRLDEGRPRDALDAAHAAAQELRAEDAPEHAEDLALARARVLRAQGDLEGALAVLTEVLDGGRAGVEVVAAVVQILVELRRWTAVLEIDTTLWRGSWGDDRAVQAPLERLWSARAEAASALGDTVLAAGCRAAAQEAAEAAGPLPVPDQLPTGPWLELRDRVEQVARERSAEVALEHATPAPAPRPSPGPALIPIPIPPPVAEPFIEPA